MFNFHPAFSNKIHIKDLSLSTVFLEDEQHYPWLILVPRKENLSNLLDMEKEDQLQLLEELSFSQHILKDLFNPTQLNVAAIGNKTPQLHIHVIARFESDPAWPQTVWDHPVRKPYPEEEKKRIIEALTVAFQEEKDDADNIMNLV